jgi:hypothetical protein
VIFLLLHTRYSCWVWFFFLLLVSSESLSLVRLFFCLYAQTYYVKSHAVHLLFCSPCDSFFFLLFVYLFHIYPVSFYLLFLHVYSSKTRFLTASRRSALDSSLRMLLFLVLINRTIIYHER